jgi:hypothetical protein
MPAARPSGHGPFRERRRAPRRRRGVRVLFRSSDSVLDEPYGGVLLDASPGGVRLAMNLDGIREGSLLLVRLPAAPAGTPWVPVTVKNARQGEVGCQFSGPPAGSLLA